MRKNPIAISMIGSMVLYFSGLILVNLWAQETGSIHGRVVDPQGAIIPNVKVTIEQIGTKISRSTSTGSEGLYTFANLNVGTHNVTMKQGFLKW
jgi:hypothetical protein